MANPGYPQMGQMPQMGVPMGGPPMMQMHSQQRPIRRGTSKAVPIVVSAGLAVGVFCGLLFGVGTGKTVAIAGPAEGNNVGKGSPEKPDEEPKTLPGAAPKGLGATGTVAVQPAAGSGSGSAAPVVAVGSAAAPVAEPAKIKLTVQVKPEAAAKAATISIDGTEATGMVAELAEDTKSVKVEVKAAGYRTESKKIDLIGRDVVFEIEMTKKSTGGGGVRPPRRPDKPPGGNAAGGGGLIDI